MRPLSPLKAAIVGHGFVSNEFHLDLNHSIEDPAPRYPKSRMFKWPINLDRYEDRLTVTHPLMLFEPFVMHVAATLGVDIGVEEHPAGGLNTIGHHCGDLAHDRYFSDLLATLAYTTRRALMSGVAMGAKFGCLSTTNARVVAELVNAPEPADRSVSNLLGDMLYPAFISSEAAGGKKGGKGRWAINLHSRTDPEGLLWATIHGIEDGWFGRSKDIGYTWVTEVGMQRRRDAGIPDRRTEIITDDC